MKKLILTTLALTLVVIAPAALAGSATTNVAVSATVINNCTISSGAVAFGNYDPLAGSATTNSGTVAIACTKNAATTITLGDGSYFSGNRRMKDSGTQYMNYELYQPPNTTPGAACNYASPTRWGTTGGEVFTPAVAPNKNSRTYNVCGSIPAGQDLTATTFNDTVVATVNF